MATRSIRSLIGALVYAVSFLMLSACADVPIKTSSVRRIPAEIENKLSPGATRQEVRTVLGQPLIDSRHLNLEVYRLAGKDMHMAMPLPIPLPALREDVTVRVLVIYDHNNIVKNIASGLYDNSSDNHQRWINAGGFSLLNTYPPSFLVGPPISQDKITSTPVTGDRCSLYLLLNDYFMGEISLDGKQFADLKGFPPDYWAESDFKKYTAFNGLLLRKEITPGTHVLSHRLRYYEGKIDNTFECKQGEILYAQLEIQAVTHNSWWWSLWGFPRLEGSITINKNLPGTLVENNKLRPVLWSYGIWYGDDGYAPPKN